MMINEQCYSMAIEKLMGLEVPIRAKYIRSELFQQNKTTTKKRK